MAKFSVSDGVNPGTGEQGFVMESTDTGMVKLSMPTQEIYVSPDTAEEIRALLALVIADARGAVS